MLNEASSEAFTGAGAAFEVFTHCTLLTGLGCSNHGEIVCEATALTEQRKLRTHLDPHRFTLAEAEQACQLIESGKAAGKVMVDLVS